MSIRVKTLILILLVIASCLLYMTIGVNFANRRLMLFSFSIRAPKLYAMLLTALAIGAASLVFQSVINNRIVTPCLLGMNSLYTLTHTAVVFAFGSGSLLASNPNLSFVVDTIIMCTVALIIYGYLFKKTKYNVLYVLLIGTVLSSLFSSIQSTMTRIMDPNEYDTLLTTLVASFSNINSRILILATVMLILVLFILRKEMALLDVISLGRTTAINLGVDYERTTSRLLLGVTVMIAIATAMVGPISFLGLIIANIARQYYPTYRHRVLITGTALFGAIVLIVGQMVSERVFSYAVPISVFITIGGGLYFLYLLLAAKRV